MPIDTTPSTVATSALQALPFSSLIGGPLGACIDAQALAARTTWTFIKEVGLNEDPTTKQRTAINVEFHYQHGGEMAVLSVPLLTIVPIPYIAIDTIDIMFKASISASASSLTEETSSHAFGAQFGFSSGGGMKAGGNVSGFEAAGSISFKQDFKANYSFKKDSKAMQESKYSVEYTMDVAVHAGQDSMPAGLATVLGILKESITSGTPGGKLTPSVTAATLDPSSAVTIGATMMNRRNLVLKGASAPAVTFALKPGTTGLKIASTPMRGTVATGTTPSDTQIVLQPGDDGVASVSVEATSAFTADSALLISATIESTPNTAEVALRKS